MKTILKVVTLVSLLSMPFCTKAQDTTKTSTIVTTTTATTASTTEGTKEKNNDFPVFYLGFRFMPTFTFLDYNKIDNSTVEVTAKVGYGYGGVMGFNLSENIALQGEVIYSKLAQQFKVQDKVNNVRLDYINIPLLMRINTGISKPVNFNVVFGPQFGINTGSSIDSEDNGSTTTVVAKLAVKSGDFGFAYGAGFDFLLGGYTRLDLGFRGVYGLVDISDNSNTYTTNEYYVLDRAHVKTYASYVGLTFGF